MEKSKYNPTIGYLKALGIMLMVLCHARDVLDSVL